MKITHTSFICAVEYKKGQAINGNDRPYTLHFDLLKQENNRRQWKKTKSTRLKSIPNTHERLNALTCL